MSYSLLFSLAVASIYLYGKVWGETTNVFFPSKGQKFVHKNFVSAGKMPGLEIWRIENLKPAVYPRSNYSTLFTGDSYIVLKTERLENGSLTWYVHKWFGSETSRDERNIADIYTTHLKEVLDNKPVEHQEMEGQESEIFLSYFDDGIEYEKGGFEASRKALEKDQPKKPEDKSQKIDKLNTIKTTLETLYTLRGEFIKAQALLKVVSWVSSFVL